jgi:NADH-quinone oxidoreductase subunit G
VAIYGGISAEEIGGRGVRWQERGAASALPFAAMETSLGEPQAPKPPPEGLLLGTYRDLWATPVTELNPALRFLAPAQRLELSATDAEKLGIENGDLAIVSANGASVTAAVAIRERLGDGTCFLVEGTSEDNANALLNGAPGVANVRKAE